MNGPIMIFVFIFLLMAKIPIGTTWASRPCFIYLFLFEVPLIIQGQRMIKIFESFPLLAVPLYILAANVMNQSKITDRLFNFAKNLVGFIPGGL